MEQTITFSDFCDQWLIDVRDGHPSTVELGRRFANKIFTQWRDISFPNDDLVYTDGPGDSGIDLAYLERGETVGTDASDPGSSSADTWYLVQSKLNSDFGGQDSILTEGHKIIKALERTDDVGPETTINLLKRLNQFRRNADVDVHGDRIVFVIATQNPLTSQGKSALESVRALGRASLGSIFDVETVSLETIFLNTLNDADAAEVSRIKVPIRGKLVPSGTDLLIGSVSLPDLWNFLKSYRSQTEDLDQLYEKNVRLFLGGRRAVNKRMQATLNEDPALFGLYNNGITLVVKDFLPQGDESFELIEPYVVNGCQTTRTIWEVFRQKLEAGGHKADTNLEDWQAKAAEGVVITKIVRVSHSDDTLLRNITRYTNSQNAVSDKDFVTLEEGFQNWKKQMAERFGIFLEIQRGGWDSRLAFQKQNPSTQQFTQSANAFDLLKVYGAGWLREAGTAFGRNAAFVPGGTLYRSIVENAQEPFTVDDLYVAFRLQEAADHYDFGRGAKKVSRRQTRFLFYQITMDLLRDILIRSNRPQNRHELTHALIKLFLPQNEDALGGLLDTAVGVVDEYLTQGGEDSMFEEPIFTEKFNNDLNGFLKWDKLGSTDASPNFMALMAINKRTMGRGNPSPRDLVTSAIS